MLGKRKTKNPPSEAQGHPNRRTQKNRETARLLFAFDSFLPVAHPADVLTQQPLFTLFRFFPLAKLVQSLHLLEKMYLFFSWQPEVGVAGSCQWSEWYDSRILLSYIYVIYSRKKRFIPSHTASNCLKISAFWCEYLVLSSLHTLHLMGYRRGCQT